MNEVELKIINTKLQKSSPKEIVEWAIGFSEEAIVTTNFRPYESAILFAVTEVEKEIKVVWCDTGYNTMQTYKHAEELIQKLKLNIQLYVPKQTVAYRNVAIGAPSIEDPKHQVFIEQVKLEPFKRALKEHQPKVWFTNIRKGQTVFRDGIDIVSVGANGIVKVSPFYHWSDQELDGYLEKNKLPNEFTYFDPTKVENNRECGLHK